MSFNEMFFTSRKESPEEPEHTPPPPWWGPPEDELGACVAESVVVARSARGVVALSHVLAYPTGVQLEFVAIARDVKPSQVHTIFHAPHLDPNEELLDEYLRIGLEFSDGLRVSNLGGRWSRHGGDEPPDEPVFHQRGGGGGSGVGGSARVRPGYWLWPLPPAGSLTIWCEWPVVDIALSKVEIDADEIISAAKRSISLD